MLELLQAVSIQLLAQNIHSNGLQVLIHPNRTIRLLIRIIVLVVIIPWDRLFWIPEVAWQVISPVEVA